MQGRAPGALPLGSRNLRAINVLALKFFFYETIVSEVF